MNKPEFDLKIVPIALLIGLLVLTPVFAFGRFRITGEISLWILGGYFFTIIIFLTGFKEYRKYTLIRDTPTSKIRSMPMGTVEVTGMANSVGETLKSPFSGEDCLLYKYKIEEYKQTKDHSYWRTIDSGFQGVRFEIKDETGELIVDPNGAELEMPEDNQFTARGDNVNEHTKRFVTETAKIGTGEGIWIFDERRRYTETYLTPSENVYIFGYAQTEKDGNGHEYPIIKHNKNAPMFMIADKSEKEVRKFQGRTYTLALVLGGLGIIGTYALILGMSGLL